MSLSFADRWRRPCSFLEAVVGNIETKIKVETLRWGRQPVRLRDGFRWFIVLQIKRQRTIIIVGETGSAITDRVTPDRIFHERTVG